MSRAPANSASSGDDLPDLDHSDLEDDIDDDKDESFDLSADELEEDLEREEFEEESDDGQEDIDLGDADADDDDDEDLETDDNGHDDGEDAGGDIDEEMVLRQLALRQPRNKASKEYVPITERLGTRGKPSENRRIRREIRKEVYYYLGDCEKRLVDYPGRMISKAIMAVYRWCRDQTKGNNYNWDVILCKALLQDICTVERKERRRIPNKEAKARGEEVKRGRPRNPRPKRQPKSAAKPKSKVSTAGSPTKKAATQSSTVKDKTSSGNVAMSGASAPKKGATSKLSAKNTSKSTTEPKNAHTKELSKRREPKAPNKAASSRLSTVTKMPSSPQTPRTVNGRRLIKTPKSGSSAKTSTTFKDSSVELSPTFSRKRMIRERLTDVSSPKKSKINHDQAKPVVPAEHMRLDPSQDSQFILEDPQRAADVSQTITDGSHTLREPSQSQPPVSTPPAVERIPAPVNTLNKPTVPRETYVGVCGPSNTTYCLDFGWSHEEFLDMMGIAEKWSSHAGFWYKIGENGKECIVTMQDEYDRMLERMRDAPRGTRLMFHLEDLNADFVSPYNSDEEKSSSKPDSGYFSLLNTSSVLNEITDENEDGDKPDKLAPEPEPKPLPCPRPRKRMAPQPPKREQYPRAAKAPKNSINKDAYASQLESNRSLQAAKKDRKTATQSGRSSR